LFLLRPSLTSHLVPTPPPSRFGPTAHTPTRALVRPNRPIQHSLFIGHHAPPARVPRVTATRVHRPPCAVIAVRVHRHPPIVDHAHSPPILSGAGPLSSPTADLGHRIHVLRATDFTWSSPVSDLLSHIHRVPSLRRQAAHYIMSP
jgi:hypothetical protein